MSLASEIRRRRRAEQKKAQARQEINCPISSPPHPCPYPPGMGAGPDSRLCNKACADSWDGDYCYVRDGEGWRWTGPKEEEP